MAYTPEEQAAIIAELLTIGADETLFDAGYKMIHHYTDKYSLSSGRRCIEQCIAAGDGTEYERGALKWIEEQEAEAAKVCEEGGASND